MIATSASKTQLVGVFARERSCCRKLLHLGFEEVQHWTAAATERSTRGARPNLRPAAGTAPSRLAFVTDAQSMLPALAVALQYAGKALIASDAPLGDHLVVNSKTVALGGTWRALVRVERIGAKVEADAVAADPMAEALAIMENRKGTPAMRGAAVRLEQQRTAVAARRRSTQASC